MLRPGQPKAVALECPSCGPETGFEAMNGYLPQADAS